ncbi:hypothetical protein GF386_02170 [Candidatus Pacearchaeota archaeon]|nr:hypothetical protein [Candidatus Pacearchaeota archaeon]MBD3282974.1 hypothetical protein [Candidatus Pacearchaeota archaeon]
MSLYLSEYRMPTSRLLYEQFADSHSRGLEFTLDEFGWLIGCKVLLKKDADRVMEFLTGVAKGVGAEKLSVCPPSQENGDPYASFNGDILPNTTLSVELGFLRYGWITHNSSAQSTPIYFKENDYASLVMEYEAWKTALRQIQSAASGIMRNGKVFRHDCEGREDWIYFAADVETCSKTGQTLLEKILATAGAVEKSIAATERLKERRKKRVEQITEELQS